MGEGSGRLDDLPRAEPDQTQTETLSGPRLPPPPLSVPIPPPKRSHHKGKAPELATAPPPTQGVVLWTEDVIAGLAGAVYETIAMATGHEWWRRTPADCKPIAAPLAQWVATLPPDLAARIEQNSAPIAALAGVITVSMPAVYAEVDAAKIRKNPGAYGLLTTTAGGQGPVHSDSPGDAGVGRTDGPTARPHGGGSNGNGRAMGGIRLPTRPTGLPQRDA